MNKRLLEEINEVRSIMDLPILNEGTGFRLEAITKAVSVLDNLFGITTKTSDEIASKGLRALDGSMIKIGKESAVILKKLGDPNNTEPVLKLIDDIYKINPTVGKFVYTTFRNAIKKEAPNFIGDLDLVVRETKKLIDDNKIEEATEYFNTEIRMMNSSIPDITDDFVDNLIKLEIKLSSKLDNVITFKPKPKPKPETKPETKSKPITNVGDESMSSGEKIFKNSIDNNWAKQVANWTDEEAEILSKYLSSKQGWITFKNQISGLFSSSKKIQDNLLLNMRKWQNASFTQKQQLEKIMENQFNQLKSRQGMAFNNAKKWVETNMKGKEVDKGVKALGEKLLKESETNSFSFIRLLFGKGPKSTITTTFSDLLKGNSNFVKIAFKYGTPPGWIWSIGKAIANQASKNSAELFAKSGLKRSRELRKIGSWFATGNPNLLDDMVLAAKNEGDKINIPKEMWKSTKNKFANMGIIGSGAYIAASAYYRYWVVSLYYGLSTWVSNLSIEMTDGVMQADLTQNKFLEKIFGYKSFIDRKVARGLVNDSIIENTKLVWDEINVNSEPWREYFGVIPSLEILSGLGTLIFKSNSNTLITDVENLIPAVQDKVNKEIEQAIYTEDNLTKFKTYMDKMLEGKSSQYGEAGFDETSFTFKFLGTGKIVKYTYKPLTNKFEKITE